MHKLEPNVQVHTRHTACKCAHRDPISHEHSPHNSTKYGIASAYDTTSIPDANAQHLSPPGHNAAHVALDKHENYSHVL